MTSLNEEAELESILYPNGTQFDERALSFLLEEYKLFVDASRRLEDRRQTMHTLFLSVNALLSSALGVIVQRFATMGTALIGVLTIGLAGILLCVAWHRLLRSYGQLNAGKFAIIHLLEQYLPAAVFTAEWRALGEGKDKKKYTVFTETEATIPIVFIVLYGILMLGSLIYFLNGSLCALYSAIGFG